MKTSLYYRLSVAGIALAIFSLGLIDDSEGVTKKITAPSAPTGVIVIGGLNSATVKWKVPASNGGKAITSYKVAYFPGGKIHVCKASSLSCIVDIPNPNKPSPKPKPVSYYFTVTAINSIGVSPVSTKSALISVRFRATIDMSNTFRVPDSTPTPTPTPVSTPIPTAVPTTIPTPSPSSKQTGVNKFDGNYQGHAVMTISPSAAMASGTTITIPISFTVANGVGTGSDNGWVFQGQLIDSSGTTSVTASSPLYGSISFTVNFVIDPNTKVMSGTGSGTRTFTLAGIGSGTMNFVFSVNTP